MKTLLAVLVVLTGVLYPFAVYYGFDSLSPRVFALVLAAVWLLRSLVARGQQNWLLTLVVLAFCTLLFAANRPGLLHWYPVLVNGLLLLVFAASLVSGQPLIERLARLQEPGLSPAGVAYTRKVTLVWVSFFAANATIAAAVTLWAPRSWWLLYNGFIAYFLIGLLFAVEWLIRQRVKKADELD